MTVFRIRFAVLAVAAVLTLPAAAQLAPCCDPCFEECHMNAMYYYYRDGYVAGAAWFDFCIETRC